MTLPEELELNRLESEQTLLTEQVANLELQLETTKTDTIKFQHRYYQTVGRLYVEIDALEASIAAALAQQAPSDIEALAKAKFTEEQAKKSAEEAGLTEAQPLPPPTITAECKRLYRKAAMLMHPDRATTPQETARRTSLMAQVNAAYEQGNQEAIEKLILEFGQDPEAITGEDIGTKMIKVIRRIAQLRRRLGEIEHQLQANQQTEIYQLKMTIEEAEEMGGNPLNALVNSLMQTISEKKIQLEIAKQST